MKIRSVLNLALVASVLAATACGDDGVDPDVTGVVDVVVHDNAAAGAFAGTAAGNFHASIRSTGGTWVDVGTPNGITIALQSTAPTFTTVHGPTSVPAGTYDRVRLTLSGVTFTVLAGGTVEGTTLGADAAALAAGSSNLQLEKTVPDFIVSTAMGQASVSFDLNVKDWLTNAMLLSQVIVDGDLRGELTATVSSG